MKAKKLYLGDIITSIIILAICAVLAVLTAFNGNKTQNVKVSLEGKTVCVLPLDRDTEFSPDGGHTTVVIKDKKAYISPSDCNDGLCMKMKPVSSAGGSVICLPNRVSIVLDNKAHDNTGGADYAAG